ncbi:hypothetical protein D3C78_1913800 [compost metagenome]
MRGTQQGRDGAVGHSAAAPVSQQFIAVIALADTGLDQGLALGISPNWHHRQLIRGSHFAMSITHGIERWQSQ